MTVPFNYGLLYMSESICLNLKKWLNSEGEPKNSLPPSEWPLGLTGAGYACK